MDAKYQENEWPITEDMLRHVISDSPYVIGTKLAFFQVFFSVKLNQKINKIFRISSFPLFIKKFYFFYKLF